MKPVESAVATNHFVEHVIRLADSHAVSASEDVYSELGVKLLAKGAPISRETRDRLLLHKLQRPLERSICVSGGVDSNSLLVMARQEHARLRGQFAALPDFDAHFLPVIRHLPQPEGWSSMLTLLQINRDPGLQHALSVAILGVAFALWRKLPQSELLHILQAGLLHDIGELYVAEGVTESVRLFEPVQWRHYLAHPLVGRKVAGECLGLPVPVCEAIAEHHERVSGDGFPLGSNVTGMSQVGIVISLANQLVECLERYPYGAAQMRVSLLLMPGVTPHTLVTAWVSWLRQADSTVARPPADATTRLHELLKELALINDLLFDLEADLNKFSEAGEKLYGLVSGRVVVILRAFSSSGVDQFSSLPADGDHASLHGEVYLVVNELAARLRALSMEVAQRLPRLPAEESARFYPLMQQLYQGGTV